MQGVKIDIPPPEEGRYGTNSREDIAISYPLSTKCYNCNAIMQTFHCFIHNYLSRLVAPSQKNSKQDSHRFEFGETIPL